MSFDTTKHGTHMAKMGQKLTPVDAGHGLCIEGIKLLKTSRRVIHDTFGAGEIIMFQDDDFDAKNTENPDVLVASTGVAPLL